MKFTVRVLYRKSLSKVEICARSFTNTHNLLTKAMNVYSYFLYFLHILDEIHFKRYQHISVNHLWASWILREHFKYCSISFVCIFRLICIKLGREGLYKTSFSNCNFHENLWCESHTVFKGVNKSLHVYFTPIFRFGFNSVYPRAHNVVNYLQAS